MIENTVDRGKKIKVFDNLFDMSTRQRFFNYVQNSMYRIGWADGDIPEKQHHTYLHSIYTADDLKNMGLLEAFEKSPLLKEVEGLRLCKANVNLSTPLDVHFVHSHPHKKAVLFYLNLEWHDGWYGETMFYDEQQKNVLFTSPYVPGRVIVFDSSVPHTLKPQSIIAAKHRFTLALFFE